MNSPEYQRGQIVGKEASQLRAESFRDRYLASHPERVNEASLTEFFQDMTSGRFWAVMSRIDGDSDFEYRGSDPLSWRDPDELERERREKKNWAIENFTLNQLQNIFDIYLDQALNAPKGTPTSSPGSYRGHSIVYEQIVDKPDSMFSDQITPQLKMKLNNGRFWEELPQTTFSINKGHSIAVVGDVLENNYEDLDVSFTPEGFNILDRSKYNIEDNTDLTHLSDTAVDNYLDFVRRIDENKESIKVTNEQISYLVASYVDVVLSKHHIDNESLRFSETINNEGEVAKPEKGYRERLEDPLVQEYIETEAVESILINRLNSIIGMPAHYAGEIFSVLPNASEVWEKILIKHVYHSAAFDSERKELEEIIKNRKDSRN